MKAFLTIHVSGHAELEKKLQGLNKGLDTRRILDEGAALIFNRMRSRFLVETDPTGAKWEPSKAAQQRARTGRGGGTLFDIGKLFRSLQLFSTSDTQRAIGTNAKSRTGFPYPIVHQFGLAGFPQREFLGFGDSDVQLMSDLIVQHIIRELQK